MAIFGFGKKKEEETLVCDCKNKCNMSANETSDGGGVSVKVLGSGCAKCNQLEIATAEALKELGIDTTIDHVTDLVKIAAYGVMSTPALVVDGKVVSFGGVLKKDEIIKILQKTIK
ncbi:MAG TPA: thioredoxin family protein [Clostridia bacterium]|nr:thioredoxin family protein [Clostridia bacterium]